MPNRIAYCGTAVNRFSGNIPGMMSKTRRNLIIPIWAALVPLVTISVTYLIAVDQEHVRSCIPYLQGCASVSSTGRELPESLVFKAGFLPTALVLALFWHGCATFLALAGRPSAKLHTLRVVGVIAAISSAVYALTLGLNDGWFPELRRASIVGYTLCTFLAEVLFFLFYAPLRTDVTRHIWLWLIILSLALPALDIIAEIAKWAGAPQKQANNAMAWNAFVVTGLYYAVVARLWWHHGFGTYSGIAAASRGTR